MTHVSLPCPISFGHRSGPPETAKIVSMVNCELDLYAVMAYNEPDGGSVFLLVYVSYYQPFVISTAKMSRAGLMLFFSAERDLSVGKSETDPYFYEE